MHVTMSEYEWRWHHPCREEVMNVEVLCTHAGNDYNELACIVMIVSVYGCMGVWVHSGQGGSYCTMVRGSTLHQE